MSLIDMCIYFVIGILSVAYPILLQVIATLDEKYASIVIVELFKKEREYRVFRVLLVVTLGFVGSYAISDLFPEIKRIYSFTQAIRYGLFLATALLITAFLLFISKILTYYTPSRIVGYFILKKQDSDYEFFIALGDILYYSIDKKQDGIAKLVHEYYYKVFLTWRENNVHEAVKYPEPYYALIRNIVRRLAPVMNPAFRFLEYRTIGGIWLIGEHRSVMISEETYSVLWQLLTIAVESERDDMVMLFWSNAHQHIIYSLKHVPEDYQYADGRHIIRNQAAVTARETERERFLEFIAALGGLLLFKNRLQCIKRMFSYTTSTPPSYDLLPMHMTQVFRLFFKFWDPYDEVFPFMTRYWYPDTEGIGSESLVKLWTCRYAAVLLLRQYGIVQYYTGYEPLQLPFLPARKAERRLWIEHLDHFERIVNEQYQNKDLLKSLGLSFLTDGWFRENGKPLPGEFVGSVKVAVADEYGRAETEQELSAEKVRQIKSTSADIIEKAIDIYGSLFSNELSKEYNEFQIAPLIYLVEKNTFADDTDIDYIGYDSAPANRYTYQMHELISSSFSMQDTVEYNVREEDLFLAVDRMQPDPGIFVLVNSGFDLMQWISQSSFPGLSERKYHELEIYTLPHSTGSRCLYIVRRDNLPYLLTKEPAVADITKYQLERIGRNDLYFSITDLFRNGVLRQEILETSENAEGEVYLMKKALLYLGSDMEIRWKKDTQLVSLKVTYSYLPGAAQPNGIYEIPPLGE